MISGLGYQTKIFLEKVYHEQKEITIRGDVDQELDADGMTSPRGLNGVMSYGKGGLPRACGMAAIPTSAVAKDPETGKGLTWGDLRRVSEFLRAIKQDRFKLWYPRLADGKKPPSSGKCSWLKITIISDSVFTNLRVKHSQGGFIVMIPSIGRAVLVARSTSWSSRASGVLVS